MGEVTAMELLGRMQALLPPGAAVHADTVDLATRAKGAYALAMHLPEPAQAFMGRAEHVLAPGWYVYAGSAYASGGIRARLRRHFRRDKIVHWHVDHLTRAADRIAALAIEGGSECGIAARLAGSGAFRHALDGFGSSDCRACPSHLLAPVVPS